MAEIHAAILEFMPNAVLQGCQWHIVDQGWHKNGPKILDFSNSMKHRVHALFKRIKTWPSWLL